MALGLSRAGFRPVLVVDGDERACEVLRANGKDGRSHTTGWPIVRQDVRTLRYDKLPKLDLLSAGAPCQPFSNGGRLLGETDGRNMFAEVVRAVREVRPRAFLIENVRGLLFDRCKPYFDYLIAQLRVPSLGARDGWDRTTHLGKLQRVREAKHEYQVEWRLLDAADFGLPQHRVRLVIVGLRADEAASTWPDGSHSRDALIEALRDDVYWDIHDVPSRVRKEIRAQLPSRRLDPKGQRWQTPRDMTKRLGRPARGRRTADPAHVSVPGARLYERHTGSILDWPAKTVKAGVHGCPGGEHVLVKDDGTHRYFTVRECATLQGFPDDYALPEHRSPAMRLLGNAVPVPLAEAIGRRLAEVLSNGKKGNARTR